MSRLVNGYPRRLVGPPVFVEGGVGSGDLHDDTTGQSRLDDTTGVDDEDGIPSFNRFTDAATSYAITVNATNNTGINATLS